jgi:hypothetical protein
LATGFYDITNLGKVGLPSTYLKIGQFVIFYDITAFQRRAFVQIISEIVEKGLAF